MWRFFAPSKTIDAALEEKLHRREKRASIAISFILILLGIAVFFGAMIDYGQKEDDPDELNAIVGVAFVSLLVFGFLSVFKFHYANALESQSLYKDGICSLIGTILSGTLFINTLLIQQAPSIWWIDPTVAMFCGFGALVLGSLGIRKARTQEKLPVFTLSWWMTSQGSKDTNSGHGETEMATGGTAGANSSRRAENDLV
jgi:hypothetical protein